MPDDTSPSLPSPAAETTLWKGHTSQWVHLGYYAFCLLLAAACVIGSAFTAGLSLGGLLVPLGLWMVRWWLTRSTEYELTTQRFKIRSGILNRRLEELELFRVKDYTLDQPLLLRLLGLGNLTLNTSDNSTPVLTLRAIAGAEGVHEKLRTAVQTERDRRRVRPLDMVGGEDEATALA